MDSAVNGFFYVEEAREIFFALNVLQAEIAGNIDQTYDLLQQALKAFVDSYRLNVEELWIIFIRAADLSADFSQAL